ncbi:MAG: gliding motility lipoprotein GldH [Bacteroidales bacterium]|nr:gliding motility lipoprotein GldH [Bacteroidales bacterium]
MSKHRPLRQAAIAIAAIFMAAAMLTACRIVPEKSDFLNVGPDGWLYGHALHFSPAMEDMPDDSMAVADMAVAVRHTNGYEFSNVWVEITYWDPDTLVTDSFNIRLADDFGRWQGTGVGVGYQKVDTVKHGARIDLRHPVGIRHIMRADTLKGIEQIGLILKYE